MNNTADAVQLRQDTLLGYTEYIREAEGAIERTLYGDAPFLWTDGSADRARQVTSGITITHLWSGTRPISVPDGLIHDWIGATCISGTTMEKALALVQDYDNHKYIYKSEVVDSKLLNRRGDNFQIYLRLLKKKIITVVLDTDHNVQYTHLDANRSCCRSSTTRITEIEDAGKPTERARLPDTGHGFLWRLSSYWRFLEREHSVYVECRAISLTRNVPKGLGWMIEPIIDKLPRESLRATLEATRQALSPTSLAQ